MTEPQTVWSKEWANRICDSVKALGFSSLTDLLASLPGCPYSDIANRLGEIAPIQVIALQFREAKLAGTVREAAKDGLCRNLVEQLPNGWGSGEKSEWQSIRALSAWSSEIQVTGECEELKPILLAVSKAIRGLPPPQGWIPSGPDDSILESVFQSHWPVE